MSAAFVAYETQKVKAQRKWVEANKNRQIIYVFDTDIIRTWCAPWRSGPVDPITLGNGYGQVLPRQIIVDFNVDEANNILHRERNQAEAVAWLLASRAMREAFSSGAPLLLTEAHFSETMKVYQNVKRDAAVHRDVGLRTVHARLDFQLASTLKAVRSNLNSDDKWAINARNAGAIVANILRIIESRNATRIHGAVREWDSFHDIVRIGNGLFKLTEFRPDPETFGRRVADKWEGLCKAVVEGEDAAEIEELRQALLPVIRRAKSRLSFERSEIDAAAVAEVAYLNRRLRAENVDLRVVLLTGDRGLALAMAHEGDATLSGSDETVSGFAFGHVRHLWSFIDVVKNGEDASAKPKELFSGLLAFEDEIESASDFQRVLLENAIDPGHAYVRRVSEVEIRDAYERWERYTKQASNTQKHFLFDTLKLDAISKIIVAKISSAEPDITKERVLSLVTETTARARDRANVEFSGIGANSLLDRHKNGIRNPPELMFDSLVNTDAIFKDLARPRRVFQTAEDFAVRFDQISLDCHQPDKDDTIDDDFRQECYLKYLVLGALFASANRWIVAEQHAESAVRIIERARALNDPIRVKQTGIDEPRSHMSGREGYFLLASSKRVRAQTITQFNEAHRVLLKARERLREDRSKGTALGVPFIRFDSEVVAIALGRYYSARKLAIEKLSIDDPCNDLVDELYGSIETLLKVFRDMHLADERSGAIKGDKLANLPAGTSTSIATNLIQVFVISEFRKRREFEGQARIPINRAIISDAVDVIIDQTDILSKFSAHGFLASDGISAEQGNIICSPLMMLYAAVGDLILGARKIPVFRKEADVDKIFDRYRALLTHYDEWRFGELRKFTRILIGEYRN
ncbi:hypothetical protein [Aquibium microcysteis]|uniref:hypothetical protein n=1 Tax=Aquibium microcysteis TaxID=675281 RepID=UPI00165CEDBB|nr:hypothetical protein [Aquibium microcysteis]